MNTLKTILLSIGLIILTQVVNFTICGLFVYVLCICLNVEFKVIYAIVVYLGMSLLNILI